MQFIWGLIGLAVGFVLIKYAVQITDTFGRIPWAEQHMRGGLAGTYSLYKIVGVVAILLSLLYMFGGIGIVLGPLTGFFGPGQ